NPPTDEHRRDAKFCVSTIAASPQLPQRQAQPPHQHAGNLPTGERRRDAKFCVSTIAVTTVTAAITDAEQLTVLMHVVVKK
ncbi:MAG: hypothetical protein LBB90_06385, partial [Tannerella sp.]|nr:hypothetical protein [Tannerella sp.]